LITSAVSAFVTCAGFGASANASDLYKGSGSLKDTVEYAPSPIWSGFYFGIHGGHANGKWDGITKTTAGNPVNDYSGIDDADQSIDGSGWFGGGQLGYNWQRGRFVTGLEADISWTNFEGSGTWTAYEDGVGNAWRKKHDLEMDYFGTARVRLGYAADAFMPYITGGLAWAKTSGDLAVTQYNEVSGIAAGTSYADVDERHFGWTIGGGIETLLSDRWSLKAEYLYVDLGEKDYRFSGKVFNGADFNTDYYPSDLDFHTFRLGLNYKFGN